MPKGRFRPAVHPCAGDYFCYKRDSRNVPAHLDCTLPRDAVRPASRMTNPSRPAFSCSARSPPAPRSGSSTRPMARKIAGRNASSNARSGSAKATAAAGACGVRRKRWRRCKRPRGRAGTGGISFAARPGDDRSPARAAVAKPFASLADVIRAWGPTHLLVPSAADTHPDHSGLAVLLRIAFDNFLPRRHGIERLEYLVHGASESFAEAARGLPQTAGEDARKAGGHLLSRHPGRLLAPPFSGLCETARAFRRRCAKGNGASHGPDPLLRTHARSDSSAGRLRPEAAARGGDFALSRRSGRSWRPPLLRATLPGRTARARLDRLRHRARSPASAAIKATPFAPRSFCRCTLSPSHRAALSETQPARLVLRRSRLARARSAPARAASGVDTLRALRGSWRLPNEKGLYDPRPTNRFRPERRHARARRRQTGRPAHAEVRPQIRRDRKVRARKASSTKPRRRRSFANR